MRRSVVGCLGLMVLIGVGACGGAPTSPRAAGGAGGSSTTPGVVGSTVSPSTAPSTTAAAPLAPGTSIVSPLPPDVVPVFRAMWFGDQLLVPAERAGLVGVAGFGATGEFLWHKPACRFGGRWAESLRVQAGPIVNLRCNEKIVAMASGDGQVLWETPIPESFTNASGNDEVLAIETKESLRVHDARTGSTRYERPYATGRRGASVGDRLVFAGDGDRLLALDPVDGHEVWTAPMEIGLVLAAGDAVYVLSRDHTIASFDATNGTKRWEFSKPDSRMQNDALLGVAGGRLVVITGQGLVLAFDIANGAPVWSFNEEKTRGIDVVPAGDHVLVARKQELHILDAATGSTVRIDPVLTTERVGPAVGRYGYTATERVVIASLP